MKGPLLEAIGQAIDFVEKHSTHGARIGRIRRSESWSLPPVAVREAVINSVAHTDYSQAGAPIRIALFDDRLEVDNPGLLPFGLTVADLPLGVSKVRNRVIGRVFHELGLVEQWGSGIQRMIAACRDAGLAAPMLEEIGIRFRVTLRTAQLKSATLDETDRAIVTLLRAPARSPTRSDSRHALRARTSLRSSPSDWCVRSAPGRRIPNAATSRRKPDEPPTNPGPSGSTCRPATRISPTTPYVGMDLCHEGLAD